MWQTPLNRRQALASMAAAGILMSRTGHRLARAEPQVPEKKALVSITLDLEMSRNFPQWETTHWDYEKGNLNEDTKRYTVEACRRVKSHGGLLHTFVVGRVFEQENLEWLQQIAQDGHPIGNHTYDHIYLLAKQPEELQYRFQRAPWLIAGRGTAETIAENIRMTNVALESRVGVKADGFRTPGGFATGLNGREDLQEMLLGMGFKWVSSKYPAHQLGPAGQKPTAGILADIVRAQQESQPYVYPSGLIEVPMSPISDIGAFRGGRWHLDDFLAAIEQSLGRVIAEGWTFDFLAHPSCLYVTDPKFQAIELICNMVAAAGEKAAIVDLGTLARRAVT